MVLKPELSSLPSLKMDWEPVILRKRQKPAPRPQVSHLRKIEEEGESFVHKIYPTEFVLAVKRYRQAAQLTQKELAMKIAVREDVIRRLEAGTGIYNPKIVSLLKALFARATDVTSKVAASP